MNPRNWPPSVLLLAAFLLVAAFFWNVDRQVNRQRALVAAAANAVPGPVEPALKPRDPLPVGSLRTVRHDGHVYIVAVYTGISVIHAPSCPCLHDRPAGPDGEGNP